MIVVPKTTPVPAGFRFRRFVLLSQPERLLSFEVTYASHFGRAQVHP